MVNHKKAGAHSWENGKKKTGRMQWPLESDYDTVTFYLEKLSWVANIFCTRTVLAEAEPAPLEGIVQSGSFIDGGDSFQDARELSQSSGGLWVIGTPFVLS